MKEFIKENKVSLIKLLISVCLVTVALIVGIFNEQISFIIHILAYIFSSYEIIYKGIKALFKEGTANEKLLMTFASLGAIITGAYFEATLVLVLYQIGELIEDGARDGSRASISRLQAIRPDKARLKGESELVPAEGIEIGQLIEVFPGERIPLDGVAVEGISSIDTAVITGESEPLEVRAGKEVLAGCLNINSVIVIEVTRTLTQSAAQRIIDLSENALEKKTKGERFISKFAKIYTPVIIVLALLVAILPPLLGLDFAEWAYKAFAMLAISCPCALVISVPLAYFCAIGYASKRGILVKGSLTLEKLESLNTLAFDKTGTLTKSDVHVTKIEAFGDYTKIKLLELVCIAEAKSHHPVAEAVRKEALRFKIDTKEGTNYQEKAGFGVECDSEYGHIKAGSKIYVGAVTGNNVGTVFVSVDGKYVGFVGVGDDLKHNSKRACDKLRGLGVKKMFILSGDKKSKVDAVASALYADGAYSQLLPSNKLSALEDIIASGENVKIGYCGDGINDLPCIARADVGISMGAVGSDSAVEKSDVVIMDDDIEKVPEAIQIARSAKRTATFNIVFSIAVKALLLALSVFVSMPMLAAVLADVGIMLIAVLNSLRAGK
ncbi:MAG: cadmium-translocating P-type ATPase [Clostridia bacterium]|nr:cadmium-translocating P-type ATPase [Clostridia bacterium]